MLDTNKIDNVHVEGIDMADYPDFCDAFIDSADFDGIEMTEEELDELGQDYDFIYQSVINQLC